MTELTIPAMSTSSDDQNMEDLEQVRGAHAGNEDMLCSESHPQPQDASPELRGSVPPSRPEPHLLPNHVNTPINIQPTSMMVDIKEYMRPLFNRFPSEQWSSAVKDVYDTYTGLASNSAFDGTPASSSSHQNMSYGVSHLNLTHVGLNARIPSLNPITAQQPVSSGRPSDSAGPSTHQDTPQVTNRESPIVVDSSDEDEDEDEDDFDNLDELPIEEEHEEMVRMAVDILTVKKEPKEEPDVKEPDLSDTFQEEIDILETQIRYNVKRMCSQLPVHPAISYRTTQYVWSKGPTLRKTQAGIKGAEHTTYYIAIISAIHYLKISGDVVCVRTLYYMVKKVMTIGEPERKCSYNAVLRVTKEICLSTGLCRDKFNIDAQSKGLFIGDVKITVKASNKKGTKVIKGKKTEWTIIPAASKMISVELGKQTMRFVGSEAIGPFQKGQLLKRVVRERSVVAISKGAADRNFLRFVGLCTENKRTSGRTNMPTIWVGDGNLWALWIATGVKRGNKATIFESGLVAPDALFIGALAADVAKVKNHQMAITKSLAAKFDSFIDNLDVPRDFVPIAKELLKGGNCVEADNVDEDELFKMIIHRGDELARNPPPVCPVVVRPVRPTFTHRDVGSIHQLEFIEIPRTPDQPVDETRYQFRVVGGEKFTPREIRKHSDDTITVWTTPQFHRRFSRQEIAQFMDPVHISLFTCFYQNVLAIAERSPNSSFREGIYEDVNVLREPARVFFPNDVSSDVPLPAALMAKVHWLMYCLFSVGYSNARPGTTRYFVCLACGRAHTTLGDLDSHLIHNGDCAQTAAKIRLEGAPEPDESNTDPHWCRIGQCKGLPPSRSEDEYDAHWLSHRVFCQACPDHFPNRVALDEHKKTCSKTKRKFKTVNPKPKIECGGCGREVLESQFDAHLGHLYACAIEYAKSKPKNGKRAEVTNINPHWCHIGRCKKKIHPFASEAAYESHWIEKHRAKCSRCDENFFPDHLKSHLKICKG